MNGESGKGGAPAAEQFKAFVGGISWQLDDRELKKVFEKYGAVDAKVMIDKNTNRSRGFGFVIFADKKGLDDAVAKLHKTELNGREISVRVAIPQDQTAPGTPASALTQGGYKGGGGVARYDRYRGGGGGGGGGDYERSAYDRYAYDRHIGYDRAAYEREYRAYSDQYYRDPYGRPAYGADRAYAAYPGYAEYDRAAYAGYDQRAYAGYDMAGYGAERYGGAYGGGADRSRSAYPSRSGPYDRPGGSRSGPRDSKR